MKKGILTALAMMFSASVAMAAAWAPTVMTISGTDELTYGFNGTALDIPYVVSGKPATVIFCVYTNDKASGITAVKSGFKGWHYVNKIDTSVFVSAGQAVTAGNHNWYWDGRDDDGAAVPSGRYTYYFWGYDAQSSKEIVNQSIQMTIGGGGKSAYIVTKDTLGMPLSQPVFFSNQYSGSVPYKKWIIGSNPQDSMLTETTYVTTAGGMTGVTSSIAIQPNDDTKFFFRGVITGTTTSVLVKNVWAPNGRSQVDAEWGDGGAFTWENAANYPVLRYNVSGPELAGDYIYVTDTSVDNTTDYTNMASYLRRISWNGYPVSDRTWSLASSWINLDWGPKPTYAGGYATGGPNGVVACGDYLLLNSHTSCVKEMVNPLAEDDADFRVWTNDNGDDVLDKNANNAELLWICFDKDNRPYTYSVSPDANGFVLGTCYDSGTDTSFGLLGPDGDGIGHFAYAGATTREKMINSVVDYGGAYDGIYCDDHNDNTSAGLFYIASASYKGVINPVGVNSQAPVAFSVKQNSPNPFNPTTTIQFTLMQDSKTTVEVFNAAGQKVDMLVNGNMKAGTHKVTWNAAKFSAGVYFYTVKSGSFSKTMKMTLLK